MFSKIIRSLWGDLTGAEIKKFGILSATLMLILGNYWMLRVMKNGLFAKFVDYQHYQWIVKIVSLVVMVFLVLGYSKLVDMMEKHKLFYLFCSFFGVWFLCLSYFIANPGIISVSETSSLYPLVSWIPGKFLGWLVYVSFEASSLVIALFWAFVASTTKAESAKKGYGMIIFFTQIGTIVGPAVVTNYATTLGFPLLVALGGILILLVPLLIWLYMIHVPSEDISHPGSVKQRPKTGFLEGLKILTTRPYVMGVFCVATFYEVIGTILEYQMNCLGDKVFPTKEALAAFNGKFGISVNSFALLFALVGTSFFMRKFGLKFCLVAFPAAIGIIVSSVFLFNSFGITSYQLMWALFAAMVGIKGLNYVLNNPTKEIMYIPTSKDIKFKAKGWIDMFGNRSTKGIGSGINGVFSQNLAQLLTYGTIISLGVVGVWIVVAAFVGKAFNKLQAENKIVE